MDISPIPGNIQLVTAQQRHCDMQLQTLKSGVMIQLLVLIIAHGIME